jgi:hypothetical protein
MNTLLEDLGRLRGTLVRPESGFVAMIRGVEPYDYHGRHCVRFAFDWAARITPDGKFEKVPALTGWSVFLTDDTHVITTEDNLSFALAQVTTSMSSQLAVVMFYAPRHRDFAAYDVNL